MCANIDLIAVARKIIERDCRLDRAEFRQARLEALDRVEAHQLNNYYIVRQCNDVGEREAAKFFENLLAIVNQKNYDNSDSMTDYYEVGFYINLYLGSDTKAFQVLA